MLKQKISYYCCCNSNLSLYFKGANGINPIYGKLL